MIFRNRGTGAFDLDMAFVLCDPFLNPTLLTVVKRTLPDQTWEVNKYGSICSMMLVDLWLDHLTPHTLAHAVLLVGDRRETFDVVSKRIGTTLGITPFDRHELLPEEGRGNPTIPIARIRTLKASLAQKPYSSLYHLVLIPLAAALTTEAQQALLKTVEEPPAPTIFILAVPDERLLLPTVVSRCQRVTVGHEPTEHAVSIDLSPVATESLDHIFDQAEKLAKDERLPATLDAWMVAEREGLLRGDPQATRTLRQLLRVKELATTTQTNKRLLLESLFLTRKYPHFWEEEQTL